MYVLCVEQFPNNMHIIFTLFEGMCAIIFVITILLCKYSKYAKVKEKRIAKSVQKLSITRTNYEFYSCCFSWFFFIFSWLLCHRNFIIFIYINKTNIQVWSMYITYLYPPAGFSSQSFLFLSLVHFYVFIYNIMYCEFILYWQSFILHSCVWYTLNSRHQSWMQLLLPM